MLYEREAINMFIGVNVALCKSIGTYYSLGQSRLPMTPEYQKLVDTMWKGEEDDKAGRERFEFQVLGVDKPKETPWRLTYFQAPSSHPPHLPQRVISHLDIEMSAKEKVLSGIVTLLQTSLVEKFPFPPEVPVRKKGLQPFDPFPQYAFLFSDDRYFTGQNITPTCSGRLSDLVKRGVIDDEERKRVVKQVYALSYINWRTLSTLSTQMRQFYEQIERDFTVTCQ